MWCRSPDVPDAIRIVRGRAGTVLDRPGSVLHAGQPGGRSRQECSACRSSCPSLRRNGGGAAGSSSQTDAGRYAHPSARSQPRTPCIGCDVVRLTADPRRDAFITGWYGVPPIRACPPARPVACDARCSCPDRAWCEVLRAAVSVGRRVHRRSPALSHLSRAMICLGRGPCFFARRLSPLAPRVRANARAM